MRGVFEEVATFLPNIPFKIVLDMGVFFLSVELQVGIILLFRESTNTLDSQSHNI